MTNTALFLLVLLLIAQLIKPVSDLIRFPFFIVLIVVGYLGSEITTDYFGIDTGLRWHNIKSLIYYVVLPIVVFQSALSINLRILRKNMGLILLLVVPLMLLSMFLIAGGLYFGINHPTGFPWIAAFLSAALLCTIEPATGFKLLKNAGVSRRLFVLLEGESLFNDATAIVLFMTFLAIATGNNEMSSWQSISKQILQVFLGGLVTGILCGGLVILMLKFIKDDYFSLLILIISAYGLFLLNENILGYSGVISVLTIGIIIKIFAATHVSKDKLISQIWRLFARLGESIVFLLAGITITATMFVDQWLAMLIGLCTVLSARMLVFWGSFPVINLLPTVEPLSFKQQSILVWGGARGTITMALALSIPLTLDYWYTVQSMAYGVVIGLLIIQFISLPIILNKITDHVEY